VCGSLMASAEAETEAEAWLTAVRPFGSSAVGGAKWIKHVAITCASLPQFHLS
jgi:hypothetical protein